MIRSFVDSLAPIFLEAGEPSPAVQIAARALAHSLQQMADVIENLGEDRYRQRPVGEVTSSVGSHVRHCLDHVAALLAVAERGLLDYDARERGTAIEFDDQTALATLQRFIQQLQSLSATAVDRPLELLNIVAADLPPLRVGTTLARELAFVLSHTIHHAALIAVMARTLRSPVPERFGYAPATLAHMDQRRCVR